jgi:hypothetical protein
MARTSLEHAFLHGESLWAAPTRVTRRHPGIQPQRTSACAAPIAPSDQFPPGPLPLPSCRSQRARRPAVSNSDATPGSLRGQGSARSSPRCYTSLASHSLQEFILGQTHSSSRCSSSSPSVSLLDGRRLLGHHSAGLMRTPRTVPQSDSALEVQHHQRPATISSPTASSSPSVLLRALARSGRPVRQVPAALGGPLHTGRLRRGGGAVLRLPRSGSRRPSS